MDAGGGGSGGDSKTEGCAIWVAMSIASAFFASMERFSCIHLHTMDDDGDEDEDPEEAKGRLLMLSRPQALPEHYYDRSASAASFTKM